MKYITLLGYSLSPGFKLGFSLVVLGAGVVLLNNLGDFHMSIEEFDDAQAHYESSFNILGRLLESAPRDVQLKLDLSYAHLKMGRLAVEQKDGGVALKNYTESLSILETIMLNTKLHL